MARIGILGGTFNPVHLGHLILAQDALERFELDRVFFVPCAVSPHKTVAPPAEAAHRVAMLEAALEGDPRMEVSRIEVERAGVSYTIDTVEEFARRYPDAELCFIIGADSLTELHKWKDIGRLLDRCTFVVLARPGFPVDAIAAGSLRLPPPWPERLLARVAVGHAVGISSSDIRMRLAEGLRVRYLVPDAVEMYIREHHLYEC